MGYGFYRSPFFVVGNRVGNKWRASRPTLDSILLKTEHCIIPPHLDSIACQIIRFKKAGTAYNILIEYGNFCNETKVNCYKFAII